MLLLKSHNKFFSNIKNEPHTDLYDGKNRLRRIRKSFFHTQKFGFDVNEYLYVTKSQHKVNQYMNYNKNYHLASVF